MSEQHCTRMKVIDWGGIVEREEQKVEHKTRMRLKRAQEQEERGPQVKLHEIETDVEVLERRRKQIEYGRSTSEYINYCKLVPRRDKGHPWTPDMTRKYSRRGWDTVVRIWRKQLHSWDPAHGADSEGNLDLDDLDLDSSVIQELSIHDVDDLEVR